MYSSGLLSLTQRGQDDTLVTRPARDDPAPQSERDLMLDSQSCRPASRPHAVTSPIAAWGSGGWGTVYRRWSPALARTGQRDRRRFSQGGHQIGSTLAPDKGAPPTNYYMRDRGRMSGRVGALCLSFVATCFVRSFMRPTDHTRARTSTRPPPYLTSTPCPYRTPGPQAALPVPDLVVKIHQDAGRFSSPMRYAELATDNALPYNKASGGELTRRFFEIERGAKA